jgi:hypothetical protein
MNSSDLIKRREVRTIYANILAQRQQFEQGCSSRIILQNGGMKNTTILTHIAEGSQYTTPFEQSTILSLSKCPVLIISLQPPIPPQPEVSKGSMNFDGSATSYLSLTNEADFRMGLNDFTIEWFQYMNSGQSFPRVFSIGSYPSANIGVSIEGSTIYYWSINSAIVMGTFTEFDTWVHFAISRNSNNIRMFKNGNQIGDTLTGLRNYNDSTNSFTIGNETVRTSGAGFKGLLTNFHWVNGTSLYTETFQPPTMPISPVSNTKLLLLASTSNTVSTDSSGLNKTVTNVGVTWSSNSPFS